MQNLPQTNATPRPHPLLPGLVDFGLPFFVHLELRGQGGEERAQPVGTGVEALGPRVHGAESAL